MQDAEQMIPVLLLKTKSSPTDGYEEHFSTLEGGRYQPQFVPVLEHKFNSHSLSNIEDLIVNRAFVPSQNDGRACQQYGGIIFTSQRAVEAFVSIVAKLRQQTIPIDEMLPSTVQLFVVGPATARSLRASEVSCSIVGEQSGNGDALALFILNHYNAVIEGKAPATRQRIPLLFLVGEQRRDIIPRTLQSDTLAVQKRIPVDEMTVYETSVMETFPVSFKAIVEPNIAGAFLQWIVVFSPTGCKAMLQTLGFLDATGKSNAHQKAVRNTWIATIGPTTRDYLLQEFEFRPDVCADKPSPEGVGTAIQRYMNER